MTESKLLRDPRAPTLVDALLPVITLMMLLAASVYFFGSDSSAGPNQIALTLATAVAALVALKNGFTWAAVQAAIVAGIGTAMIAILILLSVGGLIGTWMMSGTVPSLIYYGL